MPTIKESAKKIYYQNVKPNIDKVMTNPVTAGLVGGVSGAIGSYFYRPDFDARNAKTQDEAYKMARSTGAKTFIWNGKQYNTDYKGNPKKTLVKQKQEELDTYGITNEQTQNKNLIAERLHNNLVPYGYDNAVSRVLKTVVLNQKEENNSMDENSSDFKKKSDAFGLLLGYPQKNDTFGISDYKPKNAEDNYYLKYKDSDYMIHNFPNEKWNDINSKMNKNDSLLINRKIELKPFLQTDSLLKKQREDLINKNDSVEKNSQMDSEDKSISGITYADKENGVMNNGKQDIPIGTNKVFIGGNVGNFTIGRGKNYLSYYDKWDINPFGSGNDKPLIELGKPLNIYDRKYFDNNETNNTQFATGGQLKAQNNAGMNPYLYNSLPQYGLGSWLEENAGTIGSVAGGIGGFLIGGPAGAAIGSAALGGVGNMITQGHANEEKQDQVNLQQQQMGIQNAMNNYKAQEHPMYGTNFAMGGFMPNVNTWQYSNVGGMNYGNGGGIHIKPSAVGSLHTALGVEQGDKIPRSQLTVHEGDSPELRKKKQFAINARSWKHENGGQLNDNGAAQMTKGLDNITVYPSSSGSHESNKNGGVTIGNFGQVEKNEVRFGKYVFSDRLPYTKSK